MTVANSNPQGGDFAVHMESPQYCLLSLPIVNEGLAAVDVNQVAGMPVIIDAGQTKASLLEVGLTNFDQADVNGFLIEGPKEAGLGASGTSQAQYSVLWSGPAVLNENKVPAVDSAGNSITLANVKAGALANMQDIKFATEPEIMSVQTADGNTEGP